jgi:putative DNA methylase
MTNDDRRLIEDYLPIEAISAEASREKSVRKGHISTLHLWWARRPLVACRAAVYAALVPASRFRPANGPEEKRDSLTRANAAKFVERLCQYPGSPQAIAEAQKHILEAHAERLTKETGKPVTVEDIVEGRAPRPKVLDMFAGGGAIPLEALRLGCEAYALDLNPVAHIIQLCTLVYPQKYGKPDPNARGMTGPKNAKGETTWGGLAEEVRYWGNWVLEKVKAEIGDLYPLIPDPEFKGRRPEAQATLWQLAKKDDVPPGYLVPVAYLWTRTVRCKNPSCGATVPLVRQTWLCKKKDRYVALRMIAPKKEKRVRFEVVESRTEKGLGFDPAGFSKGGNATCPFCGTVADSDYVKAEGLAKRMGEQMMAIVCTRPGRQGKIYLSADDCPQFRPDDEAIRQRIEVLCQRTSLTVPREPITTDAKNSCWTHLYGLTTFGDLFTPRQMLCLLTFAAAAREAQAEMKRAGVDAERAKAVGTYLAALVDKITTRSNTLCPWDSKKILTVQCFGRQALPMLWDFSESNPLADASGAFSEAVDGIVRAVASCQSLDYSGNVTRGSATALPWPDASFGAVVTDPPYYDNVPYADISDFFYVWLKRTIGHLYPEHFATEGTPKKQEAVADAVRHGGSKEKARAAYEQMMAQSFAEANRVLMPGGPMVVVYAHKTTLGWSTLVDALRQAGFVVTEAWPLDTEGYRLRALNSAALASSIFLVARKRDGAETGSYEDQVRPDLEKIVRERVDALWKMGITGADLVIAAVGAGLRAYTRFSRVEYANGEEVPAEKFLAEVEGVVLETLLEKIFGMPGSGVAAVDGPSRFYVLWRYAYKAAEMEAGEAIVFTYGQNVELDGQKGLSTGRHALVEKKKGKYRLRDFTERGEDEKLGLPEDGGAPAPLIDALHRILWLVENRPRALNKFLDEARPDRERLRLVAQALAGTALAGKKDNGPEHTVVTTAAEQAALKKLVANWRALIDQRLAADEGMLLDMGRK